MSYFIKRNTVMMKFDDKKFIGNKIKSYRKKLGITQSELAEMVDLSDQHISRIENEKYTCSINLVFKLCSIFKMEIDEFFGVEKSNNSDLANFLKDLSLDQRDAIVKFCKEVEKSSSN